MLKKFKLSPIISEKTSALATLGFYSFKAPQSINKKEAQQLIANNFKVKVIAVNILNVKPKVKKSGKGFGQTKPYKKILVKLKKGQKINIFEVET